MKKKVIYPFTLFKVLTQIWRLFALLPALVLSLPTQAQKFPATVNTTMGRPHSVYLNDYTAVGSDKLVANLVFNDFNEASWNVRLRITIESTSLRIQTRPDFVPATPITLTPGVAVQLSGSDLAPYLDLPNITISGGGQNGDARASLGQNFRLPEGPYTFCVEVLDYRSGVPISNKSCQTAFLFLNDEPTTVLPMCGAVVRPTNPQNIVFQWQQSNSNSPNNMLGTEYQLTLYEVTDPSVNPLNAINNGKALKVFESDWSNRRNFVYDATAPLLDKGKRYVYRVQARDVDGKDIFKNNGLSQVCWFSYGYPLNGVVALTFPENKGGFSLRDQPVFRWKAPDNRMPGQPLSYHFRMVKIGLSESVEAAMRTNPVWYEETTPPMAGTNGWVLSLPRALDKQASYAWQVTAFSDDQQVAQSEVRRFTGPPLIEQFRAGEHTVVVQSTSNTNMTKLSGIGKVKVSEDGTMQTVAFKDLKLVGNSELWLLDQGEIVQPLDSFPKIELSPSATENSKAYFVPSALVLNKNQLALRGVVTWAFPHPVTTAGAPVVKTSQATINFDKLKLNGNALLDESNDFNLLDPLNFRIKLLTTSDINIVNNQYTLRLNGQLYLPDNVKGVSDQRVFIPFSQSSQLYYISTDVKLENNIQLLKNTGISLLPKRVFLDFSEEVSPPKFVGQNDWKGAYFESYDVAYKQSVDKSRQLILNNDLVHHLEVYDYNDTRGWVTSRGLNCYFNQDFDTTSRGKFNQFESQLLNVEMDMENSSISKGHVKGNIIIPVISNEYPYEYTLPLDNEGFREGFLDEELAGTSFPFNLGGGEEELTIYIKQAVFARQERLDMVIDIEWPAIGTTLTAVQGFRIWGNKLIGFNVPDGVAQLSSKAKGALSDYPLMIDAVGCGFFEGKYVFNTNATIVMADDIAGKDGPTVVDFYSVADARFSEEMDQIISDTKRGFAETVPGRRPSGPMASYAAHEHDLSQPANFEEYKASLLHSIQTQKKDGVSGTIAPKGFGKGKTEFVDSVYVKVDAMAAAFEGKLKRTKNDPLWGDSFQGFLNFNLRIPCEAELNAIYINGRTNDVKDAGGNITREGFGYWFGQLGFSVGEQLSSDFVGGDVASTRVSSRADTSYQKRLTDTEEQAANYKLTNGPTQDEVDKAEDAKADAEKESTEAKTQADTDERDYKNAVDEFRNDSKDAAEKEREAKKKEQEWKELEKKVKDSEQAENDKKAALTSKEKAASEAAEAYRKAEEKAENDKKAAIADPTNQAKKKAAEQSEAARLKAKQGNQSAQDAQRQAKQDFDDAVNARKTAQTDKGNADKAKLKASKDATDAKNKVEASRQEADKKRAAAQQSREEASKKKQALREKARLAADKKRERTQNEKRVAAAQQRKQEEEDRRKATKQAQQGAENDPRLKNASGQESGVAKMKNIGAKIETGIPVPPLGFAFTGIQGRVYHKMNHKSAGVVVGSNDPNSFDYIPDTDTDYGAYLKIAVQGLADQGKVWKAYGALEAAGSKSSGNFGAEVKVQLGNLSTSSKPLGTASALITFNSKGNHFTMRGRADFKTIICANGSFLLDLQPNRGLYRVSLGTKEDRANIGPCLGFGGTGYIDLNQDSVRFAIGLMFRAEPTTPWIGKDGLKFRVRSSLGAAIGLMASVQYKPFDINEMGVWMDLWAYLGVDYETFVKSGSFDVASARLQGEATFRFKDPSIQGELSGEVSIIGIGCSFKTKFKH